MEREIASFSAERDEAMALIEQLKEDSKISNKAEGLLRGLVQDVDPVIKKNKVIKDEMRRRYGELDSRLSKIEEKVNGKK